MWLRGFCREFLRGTDESESSWTLGIIAKNGNLSRYVIFRKAYIINGTEEKVEL